MPTLLKFIFYSGCRIKKINFRERKRENEKSEQKAEEIRFGEKLKRGGELKN